MKKIVYTIFLVVVLYSLYGLGKDINLSDFKNLLKYINPMWIFYLIFSVLSFYLAAKGWQQLLPDQIRDKVPFLHLYMIRLAGDTFALLNPTGVLAGDYMKYNLLSKYQISDEKSVLKSLVDFRVYSILSFILLAILSLIPLLFVYTVSYKVLSVLLLFIMLIISMIFFLYRMVYLDGIINKITKLETNIKIKFFYSITLIFKKGLEIIKEYKSNFNQINYSSFSLIFVHWVVGAMETFFIFKVLSHSISMYDALLIDNGIMVVKSIGSFVPAQIGVEEYGNKLMLSIIASSSAALWLGYTILRRLRFVIWIIISMIYLIIVKSRQGQPMQFMKRLILTNQQA